MIRLPYKHTRLKRKISNFSEHTQSTGIREWIISRYESLYFSSRNRHEQLKKYLPSGHVANNYSYKPFPLHLSHANGPYVFTDEGTQLLDFLNGYSVFIHGHNDPDILKAVQFQLNRGFFYGTPTNAQFEYCQTLVNRVPNLDKIRITNSGTEATLFAIRTAKVFTKKSKIIKFFGAYHGTHDSVAIAYNKDPLLDGISSNTANDVLQVEFNDFQGLENTILAHKNSIAAVIIEPYLGGAGTIGPVEGYLSFVREITKKHNILLIFDEVVAFRLHHGGAQSYFNINADLVTYGKFVGGGYPIGIFGGRSDLMDLYENECAPYKIYHGGTFFGYEAAMIAGKVCLDKLSQVTIDRINFLGNCFAVKLREVIAIKQLHIQVNQIGSILTLHYTPETVTNFTQAQKGEKELGHLIHLTLLSKGIFSASYGKYFFISTIMTMEMINEFVKKYEEALDEIYPLIQVEFPHLINKKDPHHDFYRFI